MSSQKLIEKSIEAASDFLQQQDSSSPSLLTSLLQDGQTLIRKKLIYAAINFLNNPRLRLTSFDDKQTFLLKKGLTQDEIDLVFELCITRPPTDASLQSELDQLTSLSASSSTPTNTFFGKLLHFAFCLTVFGTVAYGSYSLYLTKIRPYFDQSLSKRKDPKEEICDHIRAMNEQIVELNKNVAIVHEFVRTYCRARDDSLLSLKSELSSIKSLLVSRNQFPSVPTIPKWQLDKSKTAQHSSSATAITTNGHYSTSASDSGDSSKSD